MTDFQFKTFYPESEPKSILKTNMNIIYRISEVIRNIGIYLIPPFTLPFSMIDTIDAENTAIIPSARVENIWKSRFCNVAADSWNGMAGLLAEETAILVVTVVIMLVNWKARAKSMGAMMQTMAPMKII